MVYIFVQNKTHALFFFLSTFIHTSKLEMNSSRHPIVDKKTRSLISHGTTIFNRHKDASKEDWAKTQISILTFFTSSSFCDG